MPKEKFEESDMSNGEDARETGGIEEEPKRHTSIVLLAGVSFREREKVEDETSPAKFIPQTGGESRLYGAEIVAKELSRKRGENEDYLVVTTGGSEKKASGETVSRAELAARSLVKKHGLPQEKVHALRGVGDTAGNIESFFDFLAQKGEELGEYDIRVLTEGYHLPRTTLLILSEAVRRFTDSEMRIPPKVIEQEIKPILDTLLQGEGGRAVTERILEKILPYIGELPLRIVPVDSAEVIAEAAESGEEKFKAGRRYARMLRTNPWIREMQSKEIDGIIRILSGVYKPHIKPETQNKLI